MRAVARYTLDEGHDLVEELLKPLVVDRGGETGGGKGPPHSLGSLRITFVS